MLSLGNVIVEQCHPSIHPSTCACNCSLKTTLTNYIIHSFIIIIIIVDVVIIVVVNIIHVYLLMPGRILLCVCNKAMKCCVHCPLH